MRIVIGSNDDYLEPDDEPRNTRFHMRIVGIEPILDSNGRQVLLECGHGVAVYGAMEALAGVVLCTKCRDLEE
jgi:hypothetical protein